MTDPREVESKYFRGMQYGYLWWVIHPEKKIYAAIGNSGNVIYVNPEKEIVDVCWMDLEDCIRGVKTCSFENCIEMEELLMVQKTAGRRFNILQRQLLDHHPDHIAYA